MRKKVRVILAVVIAVAGICMLLYPTVADYINSYGNRKVIGEYHREVEKLDEDKYAEVLEAAKEYNEKLAKESAYITQLSDEQRQIYESMLDVSGTGIIGYIECDKADISLAIYHGTDEGILHVGAGHVEGSSLPVDGESVHAVLAGHSGLPSARLFTGIDQLKEGDVFKIHVLNETLYYEVESIQIVLPEALKDLHIDEGRNLCTLMTCTPYGVNTHRLLVTGHRIEVSEEEEQALSQEVAPVKNHRFLIISCAILVVLVLIILLVRHLRAGSR